LNRAPIEDVKAEVEPLINRAMQINPDLPEVLAVRGWLLNEEFRSEEALPLLLRATKLNPNDASSHRFLGDLYDRLAQPDEAMKHFSAAARLDPMDFISHVFRAWSSWTRRIHRSQAACTRTRPRRMCGDRHHLVDLTRAGQDR
jgi:tetratricopeptide (TPR) repeat protein